MYNFLTLFYPVVNASAAGDTAEIERLQQIKAGDPFFVVPGWSEETKRNVQAQSTHVQRIRMEVALIEHLLGRLVELKEYALSPEAVYKLPVKGELVSCYMDAIVDASGYAGKSSHRAFETFAKQLWMRVADVGEWLIENSKLPEVTYAEKDLSPIRVMVITEPRLKRYLELHQDYQDTTIKLQIAQCFDTRVSGKIIIAIGREQRDPTKAEPYTYGTLKYAEPTPVYPSKISDKMKGYEGYQQHFEFVDNIPALAVLEVQGLSELVSGKPL